MKRVTGLGGIFFKSENPEAMSSWYEKHLGIPRHPHKGMGFDWRNTEGEPGRTVWAPFAADSGYFPGKMMVNYRVDDMDALLAELEKEGVTIDPKRDDSEYGRFAWIVDPEGNRIELWQPPQGK